MELGKAIKDLINGYEWLKREKCLDWTGFDVYNYIDLVKADTISNMNDKHDVNVLERYITAKDWLFYYGYEDIIFCIDKLYLDGYTVTIKLNKYCRKVK